MAPASAPDRPEPAPLVVVGDASGSRRFYFAGFAEIGRRLGPFDVAALPIGGFSHYLTSPQSREPHEPPDRLLREAHRHRLDEHVAVLRPGQTIRWQRLADGALCWAHRA